MKRLLLLVITVAALHAELYKTSKVADFFEFIQPNVADPVRLVMVMVYRYPSKPTSPFCSPPTKKRRVDCTIAREARQHNNCVRQTIKAQLAIAKNVAAAVPQVDIVALDITNEDCCPVDFGAIDQMPFFVLYKEGQPVAGDAIATPFIGADAYRGEVVCEQDLIAFIKANFSCEIQNMVIQANKDLRRRAEIYASRPIIYSGVYPYFWGGTWQPWPWFY
ncbi:hypothetical protein M1466_02645 [Candidatus Dependentiae bacterium]|nr:hypothetical protein [Candidatus Dependentiae bacterium]